LSKDDFYKPTDIDALRMENELLTFEVRFLKTQLTEAEQLRSRLAKAERAENDKEKEVTELKRRLEGLRTSKEEERRRFEEQLETLEVEREHERWRLEEANQSKDRQLAELDRQVKQRLQEVKTLERWIEQLDTGISAMLNSRRWRAGRALGELRRSVTLQSRVPTAQEHLVGVLREFRDWKESRNKRARVGAEDGKEKELSEGSSGGPATRTPGPATGEKASTSTPTVGLSETKGLERGWRFRNRPQGRKTKTKISVISWDMTHNPVGRAHLIADALSRTFDVEIVGARFAKYGTEIWEPLSEGKIPTIDFVGQNFPAHFAEMEELAKHINGDVIFVSKPRLPSYELGILTKHFKNRPLILDVDDHELSFFGEDEGLSLDEVKAFQKDAEFLNPYGRLWTRYCESIIPYADHLTVSNAELQKKYGGTIFPHVKDERKFDPALYDRDSGEVRLYPRG
jgi:hypothetical protein